MSAISMQEYEGMLHKVLEHFYPGQWEALVPGFLTWVSNGEFGAVFGGYGGEDSVAVRFGMGLLSKLSMSDELLDAVAQMNRTCGAGHFWLTEGEKGNWQLVWGHSMMREYLETQFAVDFLVQMAKALPLIYSSFSEYIQKDFGGQRWWINDPDGFGAQALVLVSQTM